MKSRNSVSVCALICSSAIAMSTFGFTQSSADDAEENEVFAKYARYGADVWANNPSANISGEGQACISCHTSLPYALVEPLLPGSYPAYDDLIKNISNRALTWDDNTPWYSEKKLKDTAVMEDLPPDTLLDILDAADSRGVEAVFNALILAMRDAYTQAPAQADTQQAFANMWSEQKQNGPEAGRWGWIYANLIPWEVTDSDIWGLHSPVWLPAYFPNLRLRINANCCTRH